ncbi:MAG: hypothetical protein JW751_25100, partial [Polyangiaceae bacterium]|nr:hypothetical protein [Polyangiaceae bacterium]
RLMSRANHSRFERLTPRKPPALPGDHYFAMPYSSQPSAFSAPVVLEPAPLVLRALNADKARNLLRIPAWRPSSARNPG